MSKLSMDRTDVKAAKAALSSVVKAGNQHEANWKPNSLDYKVLQVNKQLLDRVTKAEEGLYAEQMLLWADLEVNRVDLKVLISTLKHTAGLQEAILKEYSNRPETHKSFADEDGRRKADYVNRLSARHAECQALIKKAQGVLDNATG